MLPKFDLLRPATLREAASLLASQPDGAGEGREVRVLAGGQSLIAAMKLGLATPSALVDLQAIPELRQIDILKGELHIGAMATHAQIAASSIVRDFCPMLADLAAGIADQQVRSMGTIGGSLANNDPAADWPCGLLAVAAVVHTTQRHIVTDDFLQGIYATNLQQGEIITHIVIPANGNLQTAKYIKFEQKASRFALVGVAVAQLPNGLRIAVTGLGYGACLWSPASLDEAYPEHLATSDLHASARYRAHLVGVLARRALKETPQWLRASPPTSQGSTSQKTPPASDPNWLAGSTTLAMPVEHVWQELLSPTTLQHCIPGCESFQETAPHHFAASIKVGIGMIAVRFKAQIELTDMEAPNRCTLIFSGDAGALGSAKGIAHIELTASSDTVTTLHWRAKPELGGKIATLAGRMLQGLSQQLSGQFFKRFEQVTTHSKPDGTQQTLFSKIKNWLRQKFKSGDST